MRRFGTPAAALWGTCFAGLVALLAGPAHGAIVLRLSDYSSDDGGETIPAELLDATLAFSVAGNVLTLDVTNLTPEHPEDPWFRISEIYFNFTRDVSALSLTGGPTAWSASFVEDGFLVNGFGLFDVRLENGAQPTYQIQPGASAAFTLAYTGAGTLAELDFATELSTKVDDHIPSYAAAKFVDSAEQSGFGNTVVPEPATLALVALGLVGALARRRGATP